MKVLRLFLYWVIGLLLGSVSVLAFAETVAATPGVGYKYTLAGSGQLSWTEALAAEKTIGICVPGNAAPSSYPGYFYVDTYQGGVSVYKASGGTAEPTTGTSVAINCIVVNASNSMAVVPGTTMARQPASHTCQPGQNWTLVGTSCTRPDCVAPQTRDAADGVCKDPECPPDKPTKTANGTCVDACAAYQGKENFEGLYIKAEDFQDYCTNVGSQNCGWRFARFTPNQGYVPSGLLTYPAGEVHSVGTGTCSTVKEKTPPRLPPELPKKNPPCLATEGVLTSTSGTVACVPEGTETARKPLVEKKTKTEIFPDGTEKQTTETKTKDPLTGAQTTTTGTTNTAKADGTAGDAGPVGTTTGATAESGGDKNGDGQGDGDGDCDGNDCGDGKQFPDTEGLWEKKYPDGITGVLNEKMNALQQTGVYQLVGQLAPSNVPSSGSCPEWSLAMNIGPHMNFGAAQLNMPCGVWSFIRLVFLISASLLARRLVFGG